MMQKAPRHTFTININPTGTDRQDKHTLRLCLHENDSEEKTQKYKLAFRVSHSLSHDSHISLDQG